MLLMLPPSIAVAIFKTISSTRRSRSLFFAHSPATTTAGRPRAARDQGARGAAESLEGRAARVSIVD